MIRIHAITRDTYVNGPGRRNMVHVQGCSLRCPGCFNPETWDPERGTLMTEADLARELLAGDPDGVTVSGGEPMEQAEEVYRLLREIRAIRPDCSILLFTGWTGPRIARSVWAGLVREQVDVLVSGPYVEALHTDTGLLVGSTNQVVTFESDRHTLADVVPAGQVEMLIGQDGVIDMTGFPSRELVGALRAEEKR